jgi:hypothetical protein
MSSSQLTTSYFSTWLKHVETTNQLLCDQQYEMALSSNGVNPQNAPVLQPEEQ